ncbi:hypothetical protein NQ314_019967 [Rhamnusium bicolor]|uniref:Reverse transcriptase zinc-binding domain-containing protein n=1 Tax=Rhamnusium bicolor TaxID=1586634 RepID=A0AAV8WMB0_9CUCU|nr:hypothetical protein NQ314_019967 [Rhamnusium bicolor]
MMSINLKLKVLDSFKQLHKARKTVFKGDSYALSEARKKINGEFKKQKHVKDVKEIEELIKYANAVETEIRTCVIQAREVEPGKYRAEITKDTLRLDNVPYKDCPKEWNGVDAKLKEIKPEVDKWICMESFGRRERTAITRLSIGHTNLTSSYLLAGRQPPRCEDCNVPVSVKHILLECPRYGHLRRRIAIPDRLNLCLGESHINLRKTLAFLGTINLLSKI